MTWRKLHTIFIALVGVLASLPVYRAQSQSMPVIGFLNIASAHAFESFVTAFHKGLNAGGYVEGRNVTIEYRWAEGNYQRLREHATDLVNRHVAVIVATGGLAAARAAKDLTDTIPILNIFGADPIGEGLVASFNRPGGNVTGVSAYASELIPKRLDLLRELVPNSAKYAVLLNPKVPSARVERLDVERVIAETGVPLLVLEASSPGELQEAFDSAARERVGALVVSPDGYFTSRRAQIVELAARLKLPVVYGWREYVVAGGLISYGPSITDAYRQIGEYTVRILKGAKPSDLPVQLPTKYEMVINLKTANAQGLTPLSRVFHARADEYIE
jgi:putative tryptophan/tyrosine transport system substrate-binding protein